MRTPHLLLIESEQRHGQVIGPLIRDALEVGAQCTLLTHASHVDIEYFRSWTSSRNFRLELGDFSTALRTAKTLLQLDLRGISAVVVTTYRLARWYSIFLLRLRGMRVSYYLHDTRLFPAPSGAAPLTWRKKLICHAAALCADRLIFMLYGVRDLTLPHMPPWLRRKAMVYAPLNQTEEPDVAMPAERVTFIVPGTLNTQARNYDSLVEALLALPAELPFEVIILGTSNGENRYVRQRLEQMPRVKLQLHSWIEHADLLESVQGGHFILPLIDASVSLGCSRSRSASAFFLSAGLGVPMILHTDVRLPELQPFAPLTYSSGAGTLAEAIQEATSLVLTGGYPALRDAARSASAAIHAQNLAALRALLQLRPV